MGVASPTQEEELYLHVVMDFIPETVYRVMKHYNRMKQPVPILLVKLYTYQMFRSLAYIHAKGICHRDIKPQNLLVDPSIHVLKLCDFGSAKKLVKGEPNVSYICSRYYRAPELIFGATVYTPEVAYFDQNKHRYERDFAFENGADIATLDQLVINELFVYRYGEWCLRKRDVRDKEILL